MRSTPAISPFSETRAAAEESGDTNFTPLEGVERNAIIQMLKETAGNKLENAKRLGIAAKPSITRSRLTGSRFNPENRKHPLAPPPHKLSG